MEKARLLRTRRRSPLELALAAALLAVLLSSMLLSGPAAEAVVCLAIAAGCIFAVLRTNLRLTVGLTVAALAFVVAAVELTA